MNKAADVSLTTLQPATQTLNPTSAVKKMLPIRKTATVMNPYVQVADFNESPAVLLKSAQRHALPSMAMYPLDSYEHIKTACDYFERYQDQLAAPMRREFAVNTSARCQEVGWPVPDQMAKFAGHDWAGEHMVEIGIDSRKALVRNPEGQALLEELRGLDKTAMDPDTFAAILYETDRNLGLDQLYDAKVLDPWLTCCATKTAELKEWILGSKKVKEVDLIDFAKTNLSKLEKLFGREKALEFQGSAGTIFDTLPLDQKQLVADMLVQNASSGT